MSDGPVQGPLGTELREATLPDGRKVTIAVKAGTSQDAVDLLAARIWQEVPDE